MVSCNFSLNHIHLNGKKLMKYLKNITADALPFLEIIQKFMQDLEINLHLEFKHQQILILIQGQKMDVLR